MSKITARTTSARSQYRSRPMPPSGCRTAGEEIERGQSEEGYQAGEHEAGDAEARQLGQQPDADDRHRYRLRAATIRYSLI